jgi:hypothetical protein
LSLKRVAFAPALSQFDTKVLLRANLWRINYIVENYY